jgi:hypothetical protein
VTAPCPLGAYFRILPCSSPTHPFPRPLLLPVVGPVVCAKRLDYYMKK